MESIEQFVETLEEAGIFNDMVVGENITQARNLWDIRESVAESATSYGLVLKYDLSLDISKFQELVDTCREKAGPLARTVTGYGHIGAGNIHLNVVCADNSKTKELADAVEGWILDYVTGLRGSISAEHGLGVHKAQYLKKQKGPEVLEALVNVKNLFDPNNIMNPNKVFE